MTSLDIGIIGAGRVGSTLGRRWIEHGHNIMYGVRNPTDTKHDPLRAHGTIGSVADAVASRDVVLVAIPWTAAESTLRPLEIVDQTVIIDATNPLAGDGRGHDRHPELSGAEQIAQWLPSARVIKAFNSTGSGNMANPTYPNGQAVMPIAGDDSNAKAMVTGLAAEVGFDPVDAGPLPAARDIEHLAVMWIRLAYTLRNGPDIAFSLMRR